SFCDSSRPVARGTPTTPPEGHARPAGNLGENKKERPLGRPSDGLHATLSRKEVFRSNPWVAPPVSAELHYLSTGSPSDARAGANFFEIAPVPARAPEGSPVVEAEHGRRWRDRVAPLGGDDGGAHREELDDV